VHWQAYLPAPIMIQESQPVSHAAVITNHVTSFTN